MTKFEEAAYLAARERGEDVECAHVSAKQATIDSLLAALIECESVMATHPAFKISTARMNARAAIAQTEQS